jgi:hypothetical protein
VAVEPPTVRDIVREWTTHIAGLHQADPN